MTSACGRLAKHPIVHRTVVDGLVASLVSAAALAGCGAREQRRPCAPLNAISHWVWPRRALRADEPSLRHTATGLAIHTASSMLWAGVYAALRLRRARPTPANAMSDAVAVAGLAAWVDLAVTPPRFTPGFEHRLSAGGLVVVYGAFALGLGLAGARR
ncbi:hypothetical protein [Piscinibacter sakaiensis]|uniref:Transmembrane protein n=1 Tax=Piscinibacter sakaiensis TaxID=1547922 RepID=A0A0K8P8C5_PISS1|nr:hypothetical protein [Piscinibacter sakaiensis]GAP38754.1 hypothetical protein ISF6_5307 [Piscinibacter sakaiensis]